MRVLALANSVAGKPSRRRRLDFFLARLGRAGARVGLEHPVSREAMRARAAAAVRSDWDVLLVVGGDGTLHEAVNGLVQAPKEARPTLAVLPLGRGNDFAAEIGIRTEEDALEAVLCEARRTIDLGRCDGRVFLGVAGTGFDACAARRAQETPWLSGSPLYTYAVLRTLLEFRPLVARVRYDEGAFEGPITFAAAANTSRYGGGMRIAPRAELDDGLLDLCLVREISRGTLLRMFPTVFSGAHLGHPQVWYGKTRFVEIETEEPAELFADGEYVRKTPLRIDLLPGELEVSVRSAKGRNAVEPGPGT